MILKWWRSILRLKEILSEEELELLRCYYEYGYTSQEIAQKLGVTETCFKSTYSQDEAENTQQHAAAISFWCLRSIISADYIHRRQDMTQSKELQNEKLINDLYEKLHWYTFEASDGTV